MLVRFLSDAGPIRNLERLERAGNQIANKLMFETLLPSAWAYLKSSSEEFSQQSQENVIIDHQGLTGAALASRYIY